LGRAFRVPVPVIVRDLDSNPSPKIRPDLRVFLFANAAHSLQIISASERPRGDDARGHHGPDSRHGWWFFFCRSVDVDLTELRFFFRVRSSRLGWTAARN